MAESQADPAAVQPIALRISRIFWAARVAEIEGRIAIDFAHDGANRGAQKESTLAKAG